MIVIKFGTASITHSDGSLNETAMADIARQVAQLHTRYQVILVSSGAVGAGRGLIQGYRGELAQRKAAAAVGNLLLLNIYSKYFSQYNIPVAQALCERRHFANRTQFLQLQETVQELWKNGIIPIANENDVVSDRELKFSDNDELATLIAVGFGATHLMLCTSVGGLLDASGQIIPTIPQVDEAVFGLVRTEKSALGLGGMASKLTFAKLATRMGIRTTIFGLNQPDGIIRALDGQTGTTFPPQESALSARRLPARQRWLGSGSLTAGRLRIDAGAVAALERRSSLLAVGVRAVEGEFATGEVVEICDEKGRAVAVARARLSSDGIDQQRGLPNVEVAHANDIVLL
ncbi:glutamate 5-kinase [Tellurirhabdus rosea]|uniref:glutamate 5-kinase n=1 Tax=Tellurirhabdus rosea TaxID=2674997 RepID=UPI00224DDCBF|nr:glutamate 5-kinase [Tellurirhabdus rosea]